LKKQHILFAVLGKVPNVITEALWYLKERRTPLSIEIDRIVVVTTNAGMDVLKNGNQPRKIPRFLGEDGAFKKYCEEYQTYPRLVENDIHIIRDDSGEIVDDVRNSEQFKLTGNMITRLLGELTKNPDNVLHCLYSGGRRSMAVYLGLALTMLGRKQDCFYYVRTTPEEFLIPTFFYPPKNKPCDIEISLEEIPFARLGEKYVDMFGSNLNYSQLVKNIQEQVDRVKAPITKIIEKPYQIIAQSSQMKKALDHIEKIAVQDEDKIMLIYGETGTGKELLARHFLKHCGRNPDFFFRANCQEIANEAFERYLFGGYPYSPNSGYQQQKGIFELANNGVVFLDDISILPVDFQNKFLRFLDDWEITPMGSSDPIPTNVRLVMTISEDPVALVKAGSMRRNFYNRICTNIIRVPALHKRKEDLPGLVELFVNEASQKYKKNIKVVEESFIKDLGQFTWKTGNAIELRGLIERVVRDIGSETETLSKIPKEFIDDVRAVDNQLKIDEAIGQHELETAINANVETSPMKEGSLKRPSIPQGALDSIEPIPWPPGVDWDMLKIGWSKTGCIFEIQNKDNKRYPTGNRSFKQMGFENQKSRSTPIKEWSAVLGALANHNGTIDVTKKNSYIPEWVSNTNERLRVFFQVDDNLIVHKLVGGHSYYKSKFKIFSLND
jgi:CRISPR-associated protein (TIGR02584 family)